MDFRGLQTFMEVAELKSFTRAAERLGYSQPTVSFQIRQLEQELGVPLFDRIGHIVSLTDAGREALQYAHQICNLSREMAMITREEQPVSGILRLGMADSLCSPLIARDFSIFRQTFPGIRLQILAGGTDELFRMLDHNEVDLICTMDNRVYDTAYVTAQEEPIGVHFVVSAENPLAAERRIDLVQLLDQPFLLTEKGISYRRLMDEQLAIHSLEVHPVLETARADIICDLAVQNMGVSFLPDYVTREAVRAGKLVRLEVPECSVTVWKQIIYRKDKWLSPQMHAMIDYLAGIYLRGE